MFARIRIPVKQAHLCNLPSLRDSSYNRRPLSLPSLPRGGISELRACSYHGATSDHSRRGPSPWRNWPEALRDLISKEEAPRTIIICDAPRFAIEDDFRQLFEEVGLTL